MHPDVKSRLIELLKEYVNIFSWSYQDMLCLDTNIMEHYFPLKPELKKRSYQDMPSLDTDIMEHYFPLKPECPPIKQKLRRTHPDMAMKIKEDVLKQIDADFLMTSVYPQWIANIVQYQRKTEKSACASIIEI